jgi:hypothetical protein
LLYVVNGFDTLLLNTVVICGTTVKSYKCELC